ncbi:MAG: hypothetical protein C0496_17420, partial [Erythrobacter sp.]|nr:hypothetical protein [Erythrobacter sp.]
EGDAVLLGNGDDLFVQEGTDALVNGNVGLQAGDDTFMLAGSLSRITGVVDGGTGVDAAFLSGILDTDRIVGFEAISLGQSAALTVSGNRSLTGNVTFDGVVRFGLGVDSLSVSGDVLLAEGAVIEIATPLDNDLVGQTVTVIAETGTFNDAGAQIVILDNDLLINYVPQFGSLSVAVNAFSPLAGSNDSNIAAFSNAIAGGVTAGTIGTANFDALNAIGDIGTFEQSLVSGLPALNDGTAREIFETSNVAAQALNRHLAGEGSRLWGQIVARGADQDARALSAVGYDSDQLVFTAGFDLGVGETLRVGVLGSYADIDTTDLYSGTASGTAQTESYKIGGYLGARFAGRGFINAEASYLTGQTEALRSGFLGTIASTTDFDGYTAQATVGYDLLPDENVRIVPAIGVNYASISFDDTRESGGFGFLIAQEDAEFVELRGGIELGAALEGGVDAFISGTVIRDLEDDASIVVLSSSQLPTFNVALPARSADRFELAAGAAVNILQNFALELGYLGDFNEGYSAHSGRVKVRFAF